jgi:MATE family multidrug resistance protein
MFGLALGNATGVLTAQALGAGERRAARDTGLTGTAMMLAVSAVAAVAILLAAPGIASLYTRDPEVRALAAQLLAYIALFQLFDTVQTVIVHALRGYKIVLVPTLVYTVALWGLGLGGGYWLGLTRVGAADALGLATPMGAAGFWLAGVASVALAAAILFGHFLRASRVRD